MNGGHWGVGSGAPSTAQNSYRSTSYLSKRPPNTQILDKIYQRPDEIEKNMAIAQQKINELGGGHARRGSAGSTGLNIHKPLAASILLSANDTSTAFSTPMERSIRTSKLGSRAKAARLIIKQKLGKNELKGETLGQPPLGKSQGHGLINDQSQSIIEKSYI